MRMERSASRLRGDGVDAATEASRAMALSMPCKTIIYLPQTERSSTGESDRRGHGCEPALRRPASFYTISSQIIRTLDMGVTISSWLFIHFNRRVSHRVLRNDDSENGNELQMGATTVKSTTQSRR